ncbi:hypothetical protein TSOC_006182 [Tetrabaena socialis]|uniref:Uncharacterized protein n=1 Tax=Tetrabaena socialis TaxID=47790 RepID=A0A2J8A4B5_9CHLO|nr:hypothetical protein TSOC_006182 [Tetrabaena socialis]|eukprot:PNH07354.1 hypothetical protein TSOC_006182 [Tetrabaena socialis]
MQEVLEFMRKRALHRAQQQQQAAAGPRPPLSGQADDVDEPTLAAMQEVPVTPSYPAPPYRQWQGKAAAGAHGARTSPGEATDPRPAPGQPRFGLERIEWIIDTACELGLGPALGLEEGPPPYPRSHRVSSPHHRQQHYRGLYSSPERYAAAHPEVHQPEPRGRHAHGGPMAVPGPPPESYQPRAAPQPPAQDGAGGDRHGPPLAQPPPPADSRQAPVDQSVEPHVQLHQQVYDHARSAQSSPDRVQPPPRPRGYGADPPDTGPPLPGSTAHRLEVAAARRYMLEHGPPPAAKMYNRSTRVR